MLPLIGRHGYLAVFLGVMAESAGVPMPGEAVLIAAGALVHRGTLNPGEVLLGRGSLILAAAVVLALAPRWSYRRDVPRSRRGRTFGRRRRGQAARVTCVGSCAARCWSPPSGSPCTSSCR